MVRYGPAKKGMPDAISEKCLGGTAMIMRYEDTPLAETVPSDWQKKVLHTTLTIGNYLLQGTDVLPSQYEKPRGYASQAHQRRSGTIGKEV
jgi:uncharacterized glyoxalase superfamily protein PhnB